MTRRPTSSAWVEALLTSAGGGGLAWALTGLIGLEWLLIPVAAINGAISGLTGIYHWRSWRGWTAFVLDSTWALVGTTVALALHAVQAARRDSGYRFDLSNRSNVHVYEGGFAMKPAYAFSVGNVVSNAGGRVGLDGDGAPARRLRFIRNHEFLHVFQNRAFGPLFQLSYLGWMVVGLAWGLLAWLRDREQLGKLIETAAYFNNPFEFWAYLRDGYWPPRDAHPRLVWGAKRMGRSPKTSDQ